MTLLTWDASADKKFESGLDRGVLYVKSAGTYPLGVAWEGLQSLTEKPGGAEVTDLWANNAKYSALVAAEIMEGTIEAYTFPDEFLACLAIESHPDDVGMLLHQQTRVEFGLSFRTYYGSDAVGQAGFYKLHLIYGCLAKPSEVARTSINDSPEAVSFSWEFSTTPVASAGYSPMSVITIDGETMLPADLAAIEDELWGDGAGDPNLPLPDALFAFLTP
ncbi:hypothetical protein KAR91_23025 [Candidatus Pacearchaeota archaeon]|nr:hypothetical protein [Candidatus Pacearchaeota archaeon]